jgi:hypothetical protein
MICQPRPQTPQWTPKNGVGSWRVAGEPHTRVLVPHTLSASFPLLTPLSPCLHQGLKDVRRRQWEESGGRGGHRGGGGGDGQGRPAVAASLRNPSRRRKCGNWNLEHSEKALATSLSLADLCRGQVLHDRRFPVASLRLFASERSAGKVVKTPFGDRPIELFTVEAARENDFVFMGKDGG